MACPSTMTAPSLGWSRPARIFSTVVLPQPEWPITQPNSPRAIESQRVSNTAIAPPLAPGERVAIASMEMNLSIIALLRERDHAREPREDLVEKHAAHADQENGDDDVGDR